MKKELQITKKFLNQIRHDLNRPHEFAYERVGFVFAKSESSNGSLIASAYQPIADENYIKDMMVGAKFSGEVIPKAMQRSLKTREAVFHIHIHDHTGEPELSGIDIRSVTEIASAVSEVCPETSHGCILLSEDSYKTYVLDKNKRLQKIKTQIVGFPFSLFYPNGVSL